MVAFVVCGGKPLAKGAIVPSHPFKCEFGQRVYGMKQFCQCLYVSALAHITHITIVEAEALFPVGSSIFVRV